MVEEEEEEVLVGNFFRLSPFFSATYLLLRELPRRGAGDDDVGGVDALQRIAQRDHHLLVTAAVELLGRVVLPYTAGTSAAVHLLFAVVEHVLEELLREARSNRETKVSKSKGKECVCVCRRVIGLAANTKKCLQCSTSRRSRQRPAPPCGSCSGRGRPAPGRRCAC